MKVIVIGGGPAGIMAAISAKQCGDDVTILEKMDSLGKKLLITGKGRCNITSSLDMSEFINNIPGNGRFLYSAFQNYTNLDVIEFLKRYNVEVKQERGNRIFPKSNQSKDVLNAFLKELKKLGVNIKTNTKVVDVDTKDGSVAGVTYIYNGRKEYSEADKVVLATGGKSYPTTGSTGDGYFLANKLGHTVTEIRPSLIPILANEIVDNENLNLESYKSSRNLCKALQGLSLRNVGMKIIDKEKNKIIYEDFGELLFTHFGVSGPTILSSSAHIIRYRNIDELLKNGNVILQIDFKPALDKEKLDSRILRDFEDEKNKIFRNSLDKLIPQKLIEPIVRLSGINPNKKVNEITKKERNQLIQLLKEFTITLSGFRPIEEAIITSGGISIKEINPKTMESKLIKKLFFAGEIIDVDAYTGGFNLQIAYSTGVTAGLNNI